MFPFKRKKEEVDDGEKELDEPKPPKKVRRRKKVEPQKPWGKIERIIVFVFLVGLPIISLLFLVHSNSSSKPKVLGDIISIAPKDISILKDELLSEIKSQDGTYGIWIQSIDNNYSLGIKETDTFDGASLFKLPLMIDYYKNVDRGKIDPNTAYTLKYSDGQSGAGVLASMPPGTVVNYADMVDAMGKDSDNTAFSIMDGILGENSETSIINQIGMKNTDFRNSITTPYDMGVLFYNLVNSNLLSGSSKDKLFSSLTNTNNDNLIPSVIPNTVRVIHKYGADDGELNDGAIIYTNKPFILVIMSKNIKQEDAQNEIKKIAKIVYDWAK